MYVAPRIALAGLLGGALICASACGGGSSSPTTGPGASQTALPGGTPRTTSPAGSENAPHVGAGVTARPGHGGGTHPGTAARIPPRRKAVPVGKGYAEREKFCALTPATGAIVYTTSGGKATLRLAVGGLPAAQLLAVDWQLNTGDGYSIGAFRTDANGHSIQSSVRMFRSPATQGDQILITEANGTQVAQLNRC
jgi:hypothetical protein